MTQLNQTLGTPPLFCVVLACKDIANFVIQCMAIADFLALINCVTNLLYKCRNDCNLCAIHKSFIAM